jgi:hypothetical protein
MHSAVIREGGKEGRRLGDSQAMVGSGKMDGYLGQVGGGARLSPCVASRPSFIWAAYVGSIGVPTDLVTNIGRAYSKPIAHSAHFTLNRNRPKGGKGVVAPQLQAWLSPGQCLFDPEAARLAVSLLALPFMFIWTMSSGGHDSDLPFDSLYSPGPLKYTQ